MPTGVALRDPREQLFAAAERVLLRHGASALTSRAVSTEAGVAKGVLYRHFADYDAFLAEFVRASIARVENRASLLLELAGKAPVVGNIAEVLVDTFDAVTVGVVALVTSQDGLRARLRETTPFGIPVLTEMTQKVAAYLTAEQAGGRVDKGADTRTLAVTLVGTAHLLFAGQLGALPDLSAVVEVVGSILVGVLR